MHYPIVVFLLCVTAACGPAPAPEEALRSWLAEAEAAVEDKDRAALMTLMSERYADARGNDRGDIDRLLRLWFLRSGDIVLLSKIDELEIMGGSAANVSLTAGMTGSSGRNLLGLDADAYRLELELEREGDDWKLIGARWARLGDRLR